MPEINLEEQDNKNMYTLSQILLKALKRLNFLRVLFFIGPNVHLITQVACLFIPVCICADILSSDTEYYEHYVLSSDTEYYEHYTLPSSFRIVSHI